LNFRSTILILPGLGSSGEKHWQTLWEKQFPSFIRVNQQDWDTPRCEDWIETIDAEILKHKPESVILVGHSLACATVVFWARRFNRKIKGAMLVAPSDPEAETYPPGTEGFTPMPLIRLTFPSITIMSDDDNYVTAGRAMLFANEWGSELINIGKAGHINGASNLGEWQEGLTYLQQLDKSV